MTQAILNTENLELTPESTVYEPGYDYIYDWEAIIVEDEDDLTDDHDGGDDEEEEDNEFVPEVWLPGNEEVGEA